MHYEGVGSLSRQMSKQHSPDSLLDINNLFHLNCWDWNFFRVFGYKNGQSIVYRQRLMRHTLITHDESPKVVDAPLTHIFWMWPGAFGSFFCLSSRSIPAVCMVATNRRANYKSCKSKHRVRSVDAHFQNGAASISVCFAYKGRQYFVYVNVQPIGSQITQDPWPRIVDTPLRLIFMMVQGAFHFLFCL